jgi:hypothetical protein
MGSFWKTLVRRCLGSYVLCGKNSSITGSVVIFIKSEGRRDGRGTQGVEHQHGKHEALSSNHRKKSFLSKY